MGLVGHVPRNIPVRYAVAHGMRTMEHLKGFLNDATLKLGLAETAARIEALADIPTTAPCADVRP